MSQKWRLPKITYETKAKEDFYSDYVDRLRSQQIPLTRVTEKPCDDCELEVQAQGSKS
jgi:hypothetical protein